MLRDCRKLDRHIAVDSNNPEILEQLQQKFETATAQAKTSQHNLEGAELDFETIMQVFEPLDVELQKVSLRWHWKNGDRVGLKALNEPELQTYLHLRAEGLTAREKMTAQQALVEKYKQQHKSDQAGVSSTKAEMEKIIGPMEQTLNVTLESVLEMKGNLWWGDFIGPDKSRFLSNSLKCTEGRMMRYA